MLRYACMYEYDYVFRTYVGTGMHGFNALCLILLNTQQSTCSHVIKSRTTNISSCSMVCMYYTYLHGLCLLTSCLPINFLSIPVSPRLLHIGEPAFSEQCPPVIIAGHLAPGVTMP